MRFKFFLLIAMLFFGNSMFAQRYYSNYTRGKGFLIRPELYNGFFVNGGYQFNPFWQVSIGAGVSIDPAFVTHAGVRAYTNEGKWAGMIDYKARIGKVSGYLFTDSALVGGASYKDLDFGIGIHVLYFPNYLGLGQPALGLGPSVTVGWNIRLYRHR